jgi:regulator of sigma E protease
MGIFFFIIGLLLFIGLVVFHEIGHYIMARRNGIDVEEFGIGFPPRAKVLKIRKGTVFTLNWLPLGGFVKLRGEHDADTEKGSFGAASTIAKTKVMLAGVVMNLISAIILFTIVALIGMPKIIDNQFTVASDTKVTKEIENKGVVKIDYIVDNSPAFNAGLKSEDRIVSIAGTKIEKPDQLSEATETNAGKLVSVVVNRDGVDTTQDIMLNSTSPYLGVAPYSAESGFEVRRSTWSAPIVAVGVSRDFTVATFKGLGTALKGLGSTFAGFFSGNKEARQAGQAEASNQVAGPVGIFTVLYNIAQEGFGLVLFIIAILSLTLAIMNVLPIPALDGGRLFVMLIFRTLRKPLKEKTEDRIQGTGFALLMLLLVVITIVDIRRF